MTITEGGYFIDPATGGFDAGNPAIAADGATPERPKTVFGLIVAGLKRRRNAGIEPNDPNWNRLVAVARAAKDNSTAWLEMADIYGDVGRSGVFRKHFASMLEAIWSEGVTRVITRYLEYEDVGTSAKK